MQCQLYGCMPIVFGSTLPIPQPIGAAAKDMRQAFDVPTGLSKEPHGSCPAVR